LRPRNLWGISFFPSLISLANFAFSSSEHNIFISPRKTIKSRFNRGNDTCESLKEGKKVDQKRGQDKHQKFQSTTHFTIQHRSNLNHPKIIHVNTNQDAFIEINLHARNQLKKNMNRFQGSNVRATLDSKK